MFFDGLLIVACSLLITTTAVACYGLLRDVVSGVKRIVKEKF